MAKIELDSLGIEELAALRENATDKLMEKVAARRAELEAELEKLSQYGKPLKKSLEKLQDKPQEKLQEPAPVAKAKKSDEKKIDEAKDPVAKAA
jgi:lysozyme family protein